MLWKSICNQGLWSVLCRDLVYCTNCQLLSLLNSVYLFCTTESTHETAAWTRNYTNSTSLLLPPSLFVKSQGCNMWIFAAQMDQWVVWIHLRFCCCTETPGEMKDSVYWEKRPLKGGWHHTRSKNRFTSEISLVQSLQLYGNIAQYVCLFATCLNMTCLSSCASYFHFNKFKYLYDCLIDCYISIHAFSHLPVMNRASIYR